MIQQDFQGIVRARRVQVTGGMTRGALLLPALALAIFVTACGRSAPPSAGAKAPTNVAALVPAPAPPAPARPAARDDVDVPLSCAASALASADPAKPGSGMASADPAKPGGAKGTGVCAPGSAFAERACSAASADLALRLFARGAPWSRVYATRGLVAWSASGARPVKTTVARGEELIVLAARAPSAMLVGAKTSYEAMRWDGSCVTLEDGEVALRAPARAQRARIPWTRLEAPTRERLLASARVRSAAELRAKACGGSGDACEEADRELTSAIVDVVTR